MGDAPGRKGLLQDTVSPAADVTIPEAAEQHGLRGSSQAQLSCEVEEALCLHGNSKSAAAETLCLHNRSRTKVAEMLPCLHESSAAEAAEALCLSTGYSGGRPQESDDHLELVDTEATW